MIPVIYDRCLSCINMLYMVYPNHDDFYMNMCINYQVYIGTPGSQGGTPELLEKMFALRAEIFNGRNKWRLPAYDGLEKDSFDSDETTYVICVDLETNEVIACWRILPTTSDYMLSTVFSELLPKNTTIKSPNIWELSRFAVKKGLDNTAAPMAASRITRDMFSAIREFAFQNGVSRFVTVMSPSLYRLLLKNGLTMPHIDKKSASERRRLGKTACYIDIEEGFHKFIDYNIRDDSL